jgi:hypothetical protein
VRHQALCPRGLSHPPLDDRRVAVIEDLPKEGAFGELTRLWVRGPTGWHEWLPSALGADERDLLVRVGDAVRLQILRTIDYRTAQVHPGSADERRRGRDLSRAIAHDLSAFRDVVGTLLDAVDRLSSAREQGSSPSSPIVTAPPSSAPPSSVGPHPQRGGRPGD